MYPVCPETSVLSSAVSDILSLVLYLLDTCCVYHTHHANPMWVSPHTPMLFITSHPSLPCSWYTIHKDTLFMCCLPLFLFLFIFIYFYSFYYWCNKQNAKAVENAKKVEFENEWLKSRWCRLDCGIFAKSQRLTITLFTDTRCSNTWSPLQCSSWQGLLAIKWKDDKKGIVI